jgi:hypothetical protein
MRILPFSGIVLCLLLLAACHDTSDPMDFVPEESLLIAELKHSPQWFIRQTGKQNPRFLLLNSVMTQLEAGEFLLKQENTLLKDFQNQPLTICWFLSEGDKPVPLFIQIAENTSGKEIERLLKSSIVMATERKFRDISVYSIRSSSVEFHFCLMGGVMLSSIDPLLLEKGISAFSRKKVFGLNKNLMALRKLLIDPYDLHVFYHPEKLQLLLKSIGTDNLSKYLGDGSRLKGWTALGLNFIKNGLQYKAYAMKGESPEPRNLALNTESLKKSLPADVVQLQARVCPVKFMAGKNPRAQNLLQTCGLIQTASFLTSPLDDQANRYRVWMLDLLRPQLLLNALNQGNPSDSLALTVPEKYHPDLHDLISASDWSNHYSADSLFWFNWQQQLYVSAYRQSIRHIAAQLMAGQNYQGNELAPSANRLPCQEMQFMSFEANALLPQYLFSAKDPGLLQLLAQGFQLEEEYRYHDRLWYINGKISLSAQAANSSETLLWQLAEINLNGPISVIERTEDQDKLLVAQDRSADVVVLNRSGKVLSRFAIGDSILGSVYPADPYGTGKTHLLFMSSSRVWLTDLSGKPLQGFPIKLPAHAAAPFCLNGKGKQLKIFVPLLNGNIQGYTLFGKPLKGWSPMLSGAVASQSLLSGYDGSGKFWLAQLSDNGQLQAWDSLGQSLFNAVETNRIHPGKVQILEDGEGNPTWMFCAGDQVYSCAYDGKTRIWETTDSNYCMSVLESKGKRVYVLSGRGSIRRYADNWSFEDVISIETPEAAEMDTLNLAGKSLLMVLNRSSQKISVYDPDFRASIIKNTDSGRFPVISNRLYPGQLIMISGDEKGGLRAKRLK